LQHTANSGHFKLPYNSGAILCDTEVQITSSEEGNSCKNLPNINLSLCLNMFLSYCASQKKMVNTKNILHEDNPREIIDFENQAYGIQKTYISEM
jgi:hypothetical protein